MKVDEGGSTLMEIEGKRRLMGVDDRGWRLMQSEGNGEWTKMDDIDTRSAWLAVFLQKAQSHSCK